MTIWAIRISDDTFWYFSFRRVEAIARYLQVSRAIYLRPKPAFQNELNDLQKREWKKAKRKYGVKCVKVQIHERS